MANGPFTIRIFVPDGDPEGVRIIDRMNWTGHGIVFPREKWPTTKQRPEFSRTGLYILQGCSTLLTDSQREYCVETTECGGVSVLIECIVLIASENVVSEAAHAGEDAGVVADARAVF